MNKNILIHSFVVTLVMAFSVMGGISTAVFADSYKGAREYSESTSEAKSTYSSSTRNMNAILARDGSVNFTKPIISKSGDGDENDGRNAAVLAIGYANLRINGGEVKTDAEYSDAVYALGDASVKLSNVSIHTLGGASNAVVVADGGTATVGSVSIEISGYSAAFSFAGGKNASEISVEKSTINAGSNNKLLNVDSDGVFKMKKMTARGETWVSKDVSFKMILSERAELNGRINGDKAGKVALTIDEKSRILLSGDSYVDSLENKKSDNSNIYANGHKLFVAGKEVSINQAEPEKWEYDFTTETTEPAKPEEKPVEKDKSMLYLLLVGAVVLFVIALGSVVVLFKRYNHAKQKMIEKKTIEKSAKNQLKKPWEKA